GGASIPSAVVSRPAPPPAAAPGGPAYGPLPPPPRRRGAGRRLSGRLGTGLVLAVALTVLAVGCGPLYACRTWSSVDTVDLTSLADAPSGEAVNYLIVGSDSR